MKTHVCVKKYTQVFIIAPVHKCPSLMNGYIKYDISIHMTIFQQLKGIAF